ncbi:hypothetical protein EJV44_03770 [Ancylobacter aquaticus]|nr:hypothetical protein EJV44_03770 [Ancylobacter aquaticus]
MTSQRLGEHIDGYLLSDIVLPQTLGRGFYMKPSELPKAKDREFFDNESLWHHIFEERLRAERLVRLIGFHIFDWVPRNPGLFHTENGRRARTNAGRHMLKVDHTLFAEYIDADGAPPDGADVLRGVTSSEGAARKLILTPQGKCSMLQGGVGCVRFRSLKLANGGVAWLVSATSSAAPDEGIPLLMSDTDYEDIEDELIERGFATRDIIGKTKFVPDEFADLFSVQSGIPRLYIEVQKLARCPPADVTGQVSVAASFVSGYEGQPRIYASYVTFDPAIAKAKQEAAEWMKQEYVERLYDGRLLTDFDQRAPTFSDSIFTMDQLLGSTDLARQVDELVRLYGYIDWKQLNRINYARHTDALIVNHQVVTISGSTNVIVNSDVHNTTMNAQTPGPRA